MSPLWHKLWRDLWRMKGQAIAIALVIALGVMMLVMMTGLVSSLTQTRDAYYERYRLAQVFAPVARAPEGLLTRLAALPGVAGVEGRITGDALVTVPGRSLPVHARALSIPDSGPPRFNDLYMTEGRRPDATRPEEIVLLDAFAYANGLAAGDTIAATMNGTRRVLVIVGLAKAPEFLYTSAPGELVPDDARFGVIWMSHSAMSAAYDMGGAFNEALFAVARGAVEAEVRDKIDAILDPYGGLGAYGLEDQFSNRFVTEEVSGLEASASGVPPVFLSVAAFLLYIVMGRMVQSEREQIGLMKAFGYRNLEVGGHYLRMILVIAWGGAALGCAFGVAAGGALIQVYTQYYKFPFLVFRMEPASFGIGFAAATAAAVLGGALVMRRVFALAPATAMRPPAPPDYSRGRNGSGWLAQQLDQPSRMVLRRLTRYPGRMLGAVIGIAAGMALTASMMTIYNGFDEALTTAFSVVDRSDATVSFMRPSGQDALDELGRIEGVWAVEPVRNVSAILRHGLYSHKGGVTGLTQNPVLNRAIDADYVTIEMRPGGIVLARELADLLHITPGEILTIEVREGRQPVIEVPVLAIAQSLMGAPAYMDMGDLNHALGEADLASGAYLRIDPASAETVKAALRDMPLVAGISIKAEAMQAFQSLMNQGAGAIRYVMGAIAFVITFGIVYNAARVAQAERARDLASLRVIGFTTGETAFVLLGELAAVVVAALPLGVFLGNFLSVSIAEGFSTELYQIPAKFIPGAYGQAALVVVGAAIASGFFVKRDIDRADLVSALKTRE